MACTAGIWALPGQLVLVEMHLAGAPGALTVLAVMLTGARFLPMTISLMPVVRDPYNRLDYNGALRNPMIPDVLVTRDGTIATVTLHNPAKLSALTAAMWQALQRAASATMLS